jgi:hypothetical protein
VDNDIYFASGVIACRTLLSESALEEIKKAKDVETLKALLSDTPYSNLDFNRIMNEFLEDIKNLAPQLYDFFFYRYESHDCKTVFRMVDGELTKDEALKIMFSDKVDALASSDVIKEAIANKDIALELIDRYYMEKMYEEYRKIGIIRETLEIEADYANTRAHLRSADDRVFIPFGRTREGVKLLELEEKLDKEEEKKLESYPYKYITTGFEPVFRYYYKRMKEIEIIRESYLLRRAGL